MLPYFGGKKRLAKQIGKAILQEVALRGSVSVGDTKFYLEPFLGMGGVLLEIGGTQPHLKKIGSDSDSSIIEFWEAVCNKGWLPSAEVAHAERGIRTLERDQTLADSLAPLCRTRHGVSKKIFFPQLE